jgi:hypothetical protein
MSLQIQSNFRPYKAQSKILQGILSTKTKHHVLVSSRQCGKTLLSTVLLLKWAVEQPNSYCLLVSPIFAQSKKTFRDLARACGVNNPLVSSCNSADLIITFKNGSTIRMVSAETDQNLRGLTLTHLVVDEAAYIKESLWTEVLKPAFMIRGKKALFVSTPRGKNWFAKIFDWGQDQTFPDWASYRITTAENPYINPEDIEQAQRTLPRNTFLAEYMGVFLDSAGSVFNGYGRCCVLTEFAEKKPGEKYYAGLDLALANDYTVLTISDSKGNLVDYHRENKSSWEEIIDKVSEKIKYWNCECLVELNSIGSVVYEILRKRHGAKVTSIHTGANKGDLIENLKLKLSEEAIKLPVEDLWPEMHLELSVFTYKILPSGKLSYSAPGGMHDDIVMSLAFLAKQLKDKANKPIVAFPTLR